MSSSEDDEPPTYSLMKLQRGAPRPHSSSRHRGSPGNTLSMTGKKTNRGAASPSQGVPLDKQGMETRYPLHAAAVDGNLDKVQSLLGLGPETKGVRLFADDEDDLGRTPLHFAAEMGHVKVCEALLGSAPDIISVKANGLFGSTALHTAAAAGQLPIVRFLLKREADVLLKNINGMTALHIAAGLGDLEICRALLEARTPVDLRSNDGKTPLMVAVQNGHRDVSGLLINYGSEVKIETAQGENALHLAAAAALNTHPDTVEWLIERGCDVDKERFDDKRPLQLACETIIDGAILDFEAQEPYWVPEETFFAAKKLSDGDLAVREHVAVSATKLDIDVEAIKRKFGISEDDMVKARAAVNGK